jgi:hypothetical protein
MQKFPFFGYIPNPYYEGDTRKVLYVLKKNVEQISSKDFYFEGCVGYGYLEEDADEYPGCIQLNLENGDVTQVKNFNSHPDFPVKFQSEDMKDFAFLYDSEKNLVTIQSGWRYEMCDEIAKSLKVVVETDYVHEPYIYHGSECPNHIENEDETVIECNCKAEEDDDSDSYPYFRFPRTKDGVAISRVFAQIFGNNIKVFAPANYLG